VQLAGLSIHQRVLNGIQAESGAMMDYSSGWALRLRRAGQRLGVLRPVVRAYRGIARHNYEQAFDSEMMRSIRPGDTVWDIGANEGYYTTRFAEAVGASGRVVAFEPSPPSITILRGKCGDATNVEIVAAAVGAAEATLSFYSSESGSSVTDGFMRRDATDTVTTVAVHPGDAFLAAHPPAIIKVDVEGFELDVLRGMADVLRSPRLRHLFVEVHFLASVQRGEPDAPGKITALLREAGHTYRWIDASHLMTSRT
jgi:FkbM family methyltransferase